MTLEGPRGPRGSRLGAGRTEAPPEAEAEQGVFPTRKPGKYSLVRLTKLPDYKSDILWYGSDNAASPETSRSNVTPVFNLGKWDP